jgi:hypothetical protein
MMTSMLVGLALLMVSGGNCAGQKGGQSPSITQKEVSLNRGNDGQKVSAKVGQPIVVTLQTTGGGHCLAKTKSAFEINNIEKRDVTLWHAM